MDSNTAEFSIGIFQETAHKIILKKIATFHVHHRSFVNMQAVERALCNHPSLWATICTVTSFLTVYALASYIASLFAV